MEHDCFSLDRRERDPEASPCSRSTLVRLIRYAAFSPLKSRRVANLFIVIVRSERVILRIPAASAVSDCATR